MQLKTTQKFIEESVNIHGDKYNYVNTIYINNRTKVNVLCYIHGLFTQSPKAHINGQGCPICGNITRTNKNRQTLSEVLNKFIEKHGTRYNYDCVVFKNVDTHIRIKCNVHGYFNQTPRCHYEGDGCGRCYNQNRPLRLSTQDIIARCIKTHGDLYDYSHFIYKGGKKKAIIICKIHGEFRQTVNDHIGGSGCKLCSQFGFDYTKPSKLYYLSINKGQAFKIGVTNNSVANRFLQSELEFINVIKVWSYSTGKEAFEMEQKILNEFSFAKWDGDYLLRSGNTELFTHDVLGLDI